jgi:hypothetical protein
MKAGSLSRGELWQTVIVLAPFVTKCKKAPGKKEAHSCGDLWASLFSGQGLALSLSILP